jgi:hypothetical protein
VKYIDVITITVVSSNFTGPRKKEDVSALPILRPAALFAHRNGNGVLQDGSL